MKAYHLIAACAVCSAGLFSSCALEPYELPPIEVYTRAFVEQFGLIDPDQDWNQAQSSKVTVNVGAHADLVKVYAKAGATYYLTADLVKLSGKVDIPLDIPESCDDLIVEIDGTKHHCVPGGIVDAVNTGSRGAVNSSKNAEFTLGGRTYNVTISAGEATGSDQFYYFNAQQMGPVLAPVEPKDYNGTSDISDPDNTVDGNYYWSNYYSLAAAQPGEVVNPRTSIGGLVPEKSDNVGKPNVFQDIRVTPESNTLVIYPMYWYTGDTHHLGVYLIDDGDKPVRGSDGKIITFPVYDQKKYDNSGTSWDIEQYQKNTPSSDDNGDGGITLTQSGNMPDALKADWYDNNTGYKYYNDPTEMPNFIAAYNAYYKSGGAINDLKNGYMDATAPNKDFYDITNIENQGSNEWHYSIAITFTPTASGSTGGGSASTLPYALDMDGSGTWSKPTISDFNCCYQFRDQMLMRSRGVYVNISGWPGRIGFCTTIKNGDIIYSQAQVNLEEKERGRDIGSNNHTLRPGEEAWYQYSYAAFYFHPVTRSLLYSFEDWTGGGSDADADLNDMVFMVKGVDHIETDQGEIPVKVTTESTSDRTLSWIVAAEDMGSIGDFDFNDMIFKLSSITTNHTIYYNEYGDVEQTLELASTVTTEIRKEIRVQAMAAGGIKRLWLHFNDGTNDYILGPDKVVLNNGSNNVEDCEWHRWFGNTTYSMINTGTTTVTNPASCVLGTYKSVTVTENGVAGDPAGVVEGLWDSALHSFSVETYFQSQKNGTINGFYVTVDTSAAGSNLESIGDDDAVMITPANHGEAPQMFLIPDIGNTVVVGGQPTTNPWSWPTERTHITTAYPRFKDWVNSASGNADWHKDTPASDTVTRPVN